MVLRLAKAVSVALVPALASAMAVMIDGVDVAGKCFNSETSTGIVADVTGDNVVVYDPDAPCPGGGSYIHYAGRNFMPMTAGAGPLVHTYHAGTFPVEKVRIAQEKIGKCAEEFNTYSPGESEVTWTVAAGFRGGHCGAIEAAGCCFSIGYGSMMKPISLTSRRVAGRSACTTRRRIGGATGYHAGTCPKTAEEAAAILKVQDSTHAASEGPVSGSSPVATLLAVIGAAGVFAAAVVVVMTHYSDKQVLEGPFIRLTD